MMKSKIGITFVLSVLWFAGGWVSESAHAAKPERAQVKPKRPIRATPDRCPDSPKTKVLEKSIQRGVDFLLMRQNKDGSFGSARNTKGLNIYAPVPGAHHAFQAAVTSLCVSALIESGKKSREVTKAIERGEQWIMEHLPKLRRADAMAIYNVWGHAYGIQALVRMHQRLPKDKKRKSKIKKLIEGQVDLLVRYEFVNGGWGYYDFGAHTRKPSGSPTSFTTGTVLVALHEAKAIGVKTPKKIVHRALATIRRLRKGDFSYIYSESSKYQPARGINMPGGSLGRSQNCNIALRLWGDQLITDRVLKTWLNRLYARNGWLDMGRKRPVPHESWFQVAGYFFYYGHYYAGLCVEQLPKSQQKYFQDHLANILLKLQEKDGSWWDYPLYDYHQQYGTAFAIMTLVRCRHVSVE